MIVDTTWKIYLLKVKRRTKKRQAKIVKILENVLKMRRTRKKTWSITVKRYKVRNRKVF